MKLGCVIESFWSSPKIEKQRGEFEEIVGDFEFMVFFFPRIVWFLVGRSSEGVESFLQWVVVVCARKGWRRGQGMEEMIYSFWVFSLVLVFFSIRHSLLLPKFRLPFPFWEDIKYLHSWSSKVFFCILLCQACFSAELLETQLLGSNFG